MPIEIHDEPATVRREVEIDATPEEVWESLASEDGRERWLEDDPDRRIGSRSPTSRSASSGGGGAGDADAQPGRVPRARRARRDARDRHRDRTVVPDDGVRVVVDARRGVSDELSPVFAALADPTRRLVLESLLRDGSTSVPELTSSCRSRVRRSRSTLDARPRRADRARVGTRPHGQLPPARRRARCARRLGPQRRAGVGRAARPAEAGRRGCGRITA